MTGQQLRDRLEERIRSYERHAAHTHKALEDPDPTAALVPSEVLESEIERDLRRIDMLTLIRDHVIHDEVYQLGEYDLEFGELVPQDEPDFFCPRCEHCHRA